MAFEKSGYRSFRGIICWRIDKFVKICYNKIKQFTIYVMARKGNAMKKTSLRLVSFVMAACMVAGMFVSCKIKPNLDTMNEGRRAKYLLKVFGDFSADSYVMDMSMKIAGSRDKSPVSVETTGTYTYTGMSSKTPSHHEEMRMSMSAVRGGPNFIREMETISGYRDGKLYQMKTINDQTSALVSSISAKAYRAHEAFMLETSDKDMITLLQLAKNKKSAQNEDGTWSATLSGYTEKDLDTLRRELLSNVEIFSEGYKANDLLVEVTVTKDHMPANLTMTMLYESTDTEEHSIEPELVISCAFKDFGTATLPEVDFSQYTEVENLTTLLEVQKVLSDYQAADEISFVSDNSNKVSYAGEQQTTIERDSVSAIVKDGKYSFDISAVVNPDTDSETVVDVTFSDGLFKMSGKGMQTQTENMEEIDARAYVYNLLDPANISNVNIENIWANENGGIYIFTIADPDYSAYKNMYSQYGAKNFEAMAEIKIRYENGKVTEYNYQYSVFATIQGQRLEVQIVSTITDIDVT